jgi:uncharacterized membrane protein
MPVFVHEWIVAPLAVLLTLAHARRALGTRRALLELSVLAAYGFALEWAAMAQFAAYHYGPGWTVAPEGVPLAVALVWAAVIFGAMTLAVRVGARGPWDRAATAAALAITLDLLMEPVASQLDLWVWTPAGHWLGVPIGNFVGWAVIVGGYTLGAERWADSGSWRREVAHRVGLCLAAIAGLIAVGGMWRGAGAEAAFAGGRGWVAWAALLLGTLALSRARAHGPHEARETLPARLGRTPGFEPIAVFALVGGAFAIDAALLGRAALSVVALGTIATLAFALRRSLYLNSFLRFVRALSFGESASSS